MSITAYQDISLGEVRPAGALPVRPPPIPGEAATGYLIRAAQANGFATPRQLWYALRSGKYQTSFDELMDRAGISIRGRESLLGPLPHYWNSTGNIAPGLAINDYNHSLMRWCPVCLESSPHLRGVWGLKLQCVCAGHRVMLVDRCPACGATQRFERSDIAKCPCGAKLAAAERLVAPQTLCRICAWLANGSVPGASSRFSGLNAAEWHRLVRYLGQYTADSQPQRPGQIAGLHRLELATSAIVNAAHLLEDWPMHFNIMLSAIKERGPSTQSLPRTFGRLYHVLYRDLQALCFQFLRDAFEAYLHENWWGLVCKRNRSLRADTVANHPRLTIREAAQQAGTDPAVVRHFVQSELVPGIESKLPSGRYVRSIHKQDVNQIVMLAQGAMTLTEAARLLALSERRMRELVVAGILTPIVSRLSTKAAAWLFSRVQLMPFSLVMGLAKNDVWSVPFRQILKSWRLRDGEFVALVKAIGARELVPVTGESVALGAVMLDADAVRAWLRGHRVSLQDWLSVDQAARLLGVKQQVAYDLVACGLLRTTADGARGRRISMADLATFKKTYVSLVTLAQHQKHSPKWTLQAIDAVPVCGPSVDGSRQYFFRRADVCPENRPPVGAGMAD